MRVLIADDDQHLREGLAALLKGQGYDCLTAVDGIEALALCQSNQLDLCILDVMMPRMDGMTLCQMLRKRVPSMPILLLTALDQDVDQVKGLDQGADDYIGKPFNPKTLLARIRALSRRYANQQLEEPEQVQCHKLSIDTGKMIARYEDKEVALTNREQTFLLFLLQNTEQTFSRDQIFDHCWHKDFLPSSRSLDQFVLTVRQKMEKSLGTPRFIKTVYGIGYSCDKQLLG